MGECGSLDLGRRPFRRDSIGLAVSDGVGVVLVAWPCGWRASGGLGLQHAALVAGDARSACCSSSHVLVCSLPSGLVSRWRARQPSSRLQWELVAGIRTGRNPWLASAGGALRRFLLEGAALGALWCWALLGLLAASAGVLYFVQACTFPLTWPRHMQCGLCLLSECQDGASGVR